MSRLTARPASEVSVQLDALADEVFGAAAAQGRAGAQSIRRPPGEIIWNTSYPDLFFLNGIADVVAPGWSAADLQRVLRETVPNLRSLRITIRDPQTIATLGASLTASGYHHEILAGMVQSFTPEQARPDPPSVKILPVDDEAAWVTFQELIKVDTAEHQWTPAMRDQLIALYRWRVEHTPTKFFVAMNGERPVGHVALFQNGATAYLHALFTHPARRRRGVGSALTLAMDGAMRVMGADRLTLQCTDNGYLPTFYHRLGFRRVGEQHIWSKL